eukprot:365634-Chlamydomonas_euryale.AAC.17
MPVLGPIPVTLPVHVQKQGGRQIPPPGFSIPCECKAAVSHGCGGARDHACAFYTRHKRCALCRREDRNPPAVVCTVEQDGPRNLAARMRTVMGTVIHVVTTDRPR